LLDLEAAKWSFACAAADVTSWIHQAKRSLPLQHQCIV